MNVVEVVYPPPVVTKPTSVVVELYEAEVRAIILAVAPASLTWLKEVERYDNYFKNVTVNPLFSVHSELLRILGNFK